MTSASNRDPLPSLPTHSGSVREDNQDAGSRVPKTAVQPMETSSISEQADEPKATYQAHDLCSTDSSDSQETATHYRKRKRSTKKRSDLGSSVPSRKSHSFLYIKNLEKKCDDFKEQIRKFKDMEQDYQTLRDKVDDYFSEIRRMHQERENMIQTIDRLRSENLALVSDNARLRRIAPSTHMIPPHLGYATQQSVPVKGGAGSLTALRPPLHPHPGSGTSNIVTSGSERSSPARTPPSKKDSHLTSKTSIPPATLPVKNTLSGDPLSPPSFPLPKSPLGPAPTHSTSKPPNSFIHDMQQMMRSSLQMQAQASMPWMWSTLQRYPGLPQSASWSDFGYRHPWRPPFQAHQGQSTTYVMHSSPPLPTSVPPSTSAAIRVDTSSTLRTPTRTSTGEPLKD